MEIRGTRVTLRPVVAADLDRLAAILATPEVARWWPAYDRARVEEFVADEPDVTVYAIGVDERVSGLIQVTEENEPEFRHASIDLFLDPDAQGQGLGPEAIRLAARDLIGNVHGAQPRLR